MNNLNKYSKINFNIAITGMLLGLALLFQYLSNFMSIASMMNINLSLAFIVPIFFITDYKFGMIAVLSKFIIGIFMNPGAPFGLVGETIGQLILLFTSLVYIHLILFFKHLKFFQGKQPIILGLVLVTILATLLMTILNGILFVPIYAWLVIPNVGFTFGFNSSPWGIKSYWAIIFAIYIIGNLVNYGISSLILIPVFKIIRPKLKENIKLAN